MGIPFQVAGNTADDRRQRQPFTLGHDHLEAPLRNPHEPTPRRQLSVGGGACKTMMLEFTGTWRSDGSNLAKGPARRRCSKHSCTSSPPSNAPMGTGAIVYSKTVCVLVCQGCLKAPVWAPSTTKICFLAILEAGSPPRGRRQDPFFPRHLSLAGRWPSSPCVLTPCSF